MDYFSQAIGWGIYILPAGMIVMGFWLILRRIEKLPRLSLERFTGFVLLFLWLLTIMQAIIPADMRDQAAAGRDRRRVRRQPDRRLSYQRLWAIGRGCHPARLAALTVTMIFDITVRDLFRWVTPLMAGIRAGATKVLQTRLPSSTTIPGSADVASNGFTPLDRPQPVVANEIPGKPVTTVRSAEAVIQWQLPDVKQILISGRRLRSMRSSSSSGPA